MARWEADRCCWEYPANGWQTVNLHVISNDHQKVSVKSFEDFCDIRDPHLRSDAGVYPGCWNVAGILSLPILHWPRSKVGQENWYMQENSWYFLYVCISLDNQARKFYKKKCIYNFFSKEIMLVPRFGFSQVVYTFHYWFRQWVHRRLMDPYPFVFWGKNVRFTR